MQRLVVGLIAAAVLVSAAPVMAQSKTVATEMRLESGVIESIDAATRTVKIRKPDGSAIATVAGPEVKRFDELKVGDKVTARYLENLVVRVKKPGEPDEVSATRATTPSAQALPGGTKAKQVTITATISAINPDVPSITFTGPDGLRYVSKVQDPAALASVKVGDKVDLVWTQAVLMSVERAK